MVPWDHSLQSMILVKEFRCEWSAIYSVASNLFQNVRVQTAGWDNHIEIAKRWIIYQSVTQVVSKGGKISARTSKDLNSPGLQYSTLRYLYGTYGMVTENICSSIGISWLIVYFRTDDDHRESISDEGPNQNQSFLIVTDSLPHIGRDLYDVSRLCWYSLV